MSCSNHADLCDGMQICAIMPCDMQIEGLDGPDARPLGTEYYTTLRSEADNEVNAATVASEEAEAEIGR